MDFTKTYLGIELGSTRIKAVLCDEEAKVLAQGSFNWQNSFENGHWTYPERLFTEGTAACYASLVDDIKEKFDEIPTTFGAIGISAMMHGYVALDQDYRLLTPFRTWRDTTTGEAAAALTELFSENIPLRWSVSHLYQSILNGESHLKQLRHITTLSGYMHYLLTGENVLGVGDAAGMFPLAEGNYDEKLTKKIDEKIASHGYEFKITNLLPAILFAGQSAGKLTEEGARLLDRSGKLQSGIPFCPPEGDAATGMVAVNAVTMGEGSVSAGTSAFAMLVTPNKPQEINRDVDIVATPDGKNVAMIHVNNCCGEIDAWVDLFCEFLALSGQNVDKGKAYELLYTNTLHASKDCGGITAYNFISAEPILQVGAPCPSVLRKEANMSLADFFKAQLYSTVSALAIGVDDFKEKEHVELKNLKASGGIFKVPNIAQQIYADALDCPIILTDTAGEGGAWGMAVLALYLANAQQPFDAWLSQKIFAKADAVSLAPTKEGRENFMAFMENYKENLKKFRC